MQSILKFSILLFSFTILTLSSCSKDDEPNETKENGTLTLLLDNRLGGKTVSIKETGSKDYDYTDNAGQSYNISRYGYYISAIELEGPNGSKHIDPLNVSANADEVTGYYHVLSTSNSSNVITLSDIKAGTYDKLKFTVGVDESGVSQGAAGGVLDPANGAWFWNWNAGYIGFGLEGNASNSGQEYVDWGNGFETLEGTFAVHVGGWKDIEPAAGEDPKFVNNIRTIEIPLETNLSIEKGLTPKAHINVDFDELLKGIDFSTTYSIHRPDLGKPFADRLAQVFDLDHVHQ